METGYLSSYFPIIIFLGIAMVLSCLMVAAAWLVGKQKPDAEKNSAYECGFPTFSDSRHRFEVRYYLVAIRRLRLLVDDAVPGRADDRLYL
jgi:NADH-quinone oxidoreductase subunit A